MPNPIWQNSKPRQARQQSKFIASLHQMETMVIMLNVDHFIQFNDHVRHDATV